MGVWFWLNVPLMLLFLGCWAAIPMWHTLQRWDAELKEKHAGLAARAVPEPVMALAAPAMAGYQTTAPWPAPAARAIPDQRSAAPAIGANPE